jgi:predicted HAD superfamily Cof-like phosphohydrolase
MQNNEAINPQTLVAEFMRAFETSNDVRLWSRLIEEELKELAEAMDAVNKAAIHTPQLYADVLKEGCDLLYVLIGYQLVTEDTIIDIKREPLEAIKESIKVVIDVFGVHFWQGFVRVHYSNMTKLGEDGKPVRREDGKIIKGPNYRAPALLDLAKITMGIE